MTSLAAKAVAEDVIKLVKNGEVPNMQELQIKHGYSPKSARSMKVKETKTFQTLVAPVVTKMEQIRAKMVDEMEVKDLSNEKLSDLSTVVKNLTHDIQLLSGGKTENIGFEEERKELQAVLMKIRG